MGLTPHGYNLAAPHGLTLDTVYLAFLSFAEDLFSGR